MDEHLRRHTTRSEQAMHDNRIANSADGRRVSVLLAWFPGLTHASAEQHRNWHLTGDGQGIHYSDVDEDLSVVE